jgi:hypothetical protein
LRVCIVALLPIDPWLNFSYSKKWTFVDDLLAGYEPMNQESPDYRSVNESIDHDPYLLPDVRRVLGNEGYL